MKSLIFDRWSTLVLIVAVVFFGVTFLKENTNSIAYENTSKSQFITTRGSYICLPHKDIPTVTTHECTYGLQTEANTYYALDTSDLESPIIENLQSGEVITVSGLFVPNKQLDTENILLKYDIVGVIAVTSIKSM